MDVMSDVSAKEPTGCEIQKALALKLLTDVDSIVKTVIGGRSITKSVMDSAQLAAQKIVAAWRHENGFGKEYDVTLFVTGMHDIGARPSKGLTDLYHGIVKKVDHE